MATSFQVLPFGAHLLEPGIKENFELGLDGSRPTYFDQLLRVESSEKAKETLRSYANLGAMSSMAHGGYIPSDTLVNGYPTVFTHVKYGKVIGIDKESWDDDQYDVIRGAPKMLGESARVTKEIIAHAPFNQAFATALGDGVVLCSNAHPLPKAGGTDTNLLGTAGDPSYSTFVGMAKLLQLQKDAAGNPVEFRDAQKIWLVHPNYWDVAVQAVGDVALGLASSPATANANSGIKNPWAGNIRVIASPWLTDLNASFLIAAGKHRGYFFVRKDATSPKVWDEPNPEVVYAAVTGRFSAGFADWRGLVGTPGAS
jgi:hypothetical protein